MRMGDWSSDVCSSDLGRFDFISHTGIEGVEKKDILMSYGPASDAKIKGYLGFALEPKLSTSYYPIEKALSLKSNEFTVNKYLFTALRATSKVSFYQGLTSNCVNWASLGLWLNGIPNIGIHPFLPQPEIKVIALIAESKKAVIFIAIFLFIAILRFK